MAAFFSNLKSLFTSVFNRSEKIVVLPQNEDEYERMLGV